MNPIPAEKDLQAEPDSCNGIPAGAGDNTKTLIEQKVDVV